VWENPIYNNLGEFGEAPLFELIGAASSACQPDKAETLAIKTADDGSGEIALNENSASDGNLYFVAIDSHDSSVTELTAELHGAAGTLETMEINRHPRFRANGRFFLPILDRAGLPDSITIKTNAQKLTGASASLCRLPLSEG
jgi:alginate biosynthesis protein AlgX